MFVEKFEAVYSFVGGVKMEEKIRIREKTMRTGGSNFTQNLLIELVLRRIGGAIYTFDASEMMQYPTISAVIVKKQHPEELTGGDTAEFWLWPEVPENCYKI